MGRFQVKVFRTRVDHITLTVEAEDSCEAIDIAEELCDKTEDGIDWKDEEVSFGDFDVTEYVD